MTSPLPERLPVRSTGRLGRPGDPWNLLFIGHEPSVIAALKGSGWTRLSRSIPVSIAQGISQLLRGQRLTLFPPMNIYRLFGRPQDHNWSQTVRPLVERHHFRLWRVDFQDSTGRPYWWGSANYDRDARFWDLSHIPDPDIDAERDYIAGSLAESPYVESIEHVQARRIPARGANDKGYPFFNDQRVLVVTLTDAAGSGR